MKKIFTLFFAATLVSVAAFSQERHHNDGGYSNSYQYPSPNNEYANSYNGGWNGRFDDHFDHDRKFREKEWRRHERFERRHRHDRMFEGRDYDNWGRDFYGHKRKVAFQIIMGRRDRF